MLVFLLAGLFFAAALPLSAQTKSKKKPVSSEAKPAKKKSVSQEPGKKAPIKTSTGKGVDSAKSKAAESTSVETGKPSEVKAEGTPPVTIQTAPNASITPAEIQEFQAQPAGVQKIIEFSLALAHQNLTYTFGSADPANGGMDCSGFIYYVLRQHGLTQVPRDSSGIYSWTRKARSFRAVVSRKADGFEMDELLPGDLLFWTGTYATENDPPVTHTMIYLGTEKSTGAKIMIGSSDGRTYRGQKRNGVSVFDFTMPRTPSTGEQRSTFIGYARIPGLRD